MFLVGVLISTLDACKKCRQAVKVWGCVPIQRANGFTDGASMFHIKKKDKEKEKAKEKDLSKKDKKEKKEPMSQAELNSLDEIKIRRNIFHSGSSKRGAKKKLEISNPIPIKVVTNTELSLTNLQAEPLSITLRRDVGQTCPSTSATDGNETEHNRSSVKERAARFGELAKTNSLGGQKQVNLNQNTKEISTFPASSPSAQKRTKNNSVSHPSPISTIKSHIPEVVETTFPGANLELPILAAPSVPDSRELEIQRRNTGDFGFSLRRTTMLERLSDGGVSRRLVHFAEPGAGTKDWALGLVPGDKLVEINGVNVENKSRDEIVEMIRQSGESVRLKVQPILELSELSRSWLRSSQGLPKEISDVSNAVETKCANSCISCEFNFHEDIFLYLL